MVPLLLKLCTTALTVFERSISPTVKLPLAPRKLLVSAMLALLLLPVATVIVGTSFVPLIVRVTSWVVVALAVSDTLTR